MKQIVFIFILSPEDVKMLGYKLSTDYVYLISNTSLSKHVFKYKYKYKLL